MIAVAALITLCGGNAFGADSAVSERPRGQILERIREKLDLSDDQVSQIKAELGAERDTLKTLISKLHEARVGVREAIRATNASETSVRAAAAKVGAAQADLAVERFKLYGRINPILTDEQREKVKQWESQIDDWVEGAVNRLGERLQNK